MDDYSTGKIYVHQKSKRNCNKLIFYGLLLKLITDSFYYRRAGVSTKDDSLNLFL